MPPAPTSALGSAILQRLQRSPMSGYELKKRFASSVGFGWRAYDTQIYRELKTLEASGLVAGRTDRGGRGPERRIYFLTESGYEALRAWLESSLEEPWHKSELNIRIWSMDLIAPERLEELLRSVEQSTQEHLDQLMDRRTELRERYGPPEVASEGAGIGHQLILEFDVQMAQLKLAFIDRVRAVAEVRSVVEASRPSKSRKGRLSWS
jgi:DNA-binding PadR family transcriptional regulator